MGTENAVGLILDENLEAIGRLSRLSGREPVGGFSTLQAELAPLLASCRLAQSHGRDRGNGKGNARHAMIVRLAVIALQEIGRILQTCDELCGVSRNGRFCH